MISIIIIPSLIGAIAVAFNKCNTANCIWAVSNLLMIYWNWVNNDFSQVILFGVYWIISLYGVFRYLKTLNL